MRLLTCSLMSKSLLASRSSPCLGLVMIVVTILSKDGMSPMAVIYQKLSPHERHSIYHTNWVARSIFILQAIRKGLAITYVNEVNFITRQSQERQTEMKIQRCTYVSDGDWPGATPFAPLPWPSRKLAVAILFAARQVSVASCRGTRLGPSMLLPSLLRNNLRDNVKAPSMKPAESAKTGRSLLKIIVSR